MSAADRTKKLEEFKSYYLGNAKYSHEKLNGSKANVEVSGVGYQKSVHKTVSQNETFDLVKENNYWRIEGARLSASFRVN